MRYIPNMHMHLNVGSLANDTVLGDYGIFIYGAYLVDLWPREWRLILLLIRDLFISWFVALNNQLFPTSTGTDQASPAFMHAIPTMKDCILINHTSKQILPLFSCFCHYPFCNNIEKSNKVLKADQDVVEGVKNWEIKDANKKDRISINNWWNRFSCSYLESCLLRMLSLGEHKFKASLGLYNELRLVYVTSWDLISW